MQMLSDRTVATIVFVVVSASLPLYLHGIWVILRSERVTWSVLVAHLRSIIPALLLTFVPVVVWMLPRMIGGQVSGLIGVHAFVALQSYALLLIGFWGIIPIYRAKRRYNLYRDPDRDVDLGELDEKMPHWRRRLRIGVFGHFALWLLAYGIGIVIYVRGYLLAG